MLINANEFIHVNASSIKKESGRIIESQYALRTQNASLLSCEDSLISYLSGDVKTVYEEFEMYARAKMELLCDVIEGLADNNISYAIDAEQIDTEAENQAINGGY